jgi:hypothetical protein
MDSPPTSKSKSIAAGAPAPRQAGGADTTGGTAVAVTAVRLPERRNHEAQQQLELRPPSDGGEGGASAPPVVRLIRWLP